MITSPLDPTDTRTARAVARLHMKGIPGGFLSSLGEGFLAKLYRAIAADPGSVVLTVERESATTRPSPDLSQALGFLAGTRDTAAMYRRVLRKHWLSFSLLLLPRVFSPRTIGYARETLRYGKPNRTQHTRTLNDEPRTTNDERRTPNSELLSIAVTPEARGQGLGRELVNAFEKWLVTRAQEPRQIAAEHYTVVTAAADPVSNAFYRSCGFELVREFAHHGNTMNEYSRACAASRAKHAWPQNPQSK
jgi:ribosomal protein S18 acetylase RimI-like enzyme